MKKSLLRKKLSIEKKKKKSNLKGKRNWERRIKKGRKYRKLGGGIYIHLQQNGPVFRLVVPFVRPTVISFPSKTRSEHSSSPPSVYLGKFFSYVF